MYRHPNTTEADHNQPVFTVSELSLALKRHIEAGFEKVRVKGEISGFKQAASGHLYFALKDSESVLEAVCWRAVAQRLALTVEDGLEVVASGRITTYPGRSKYQIVIEAIEIAGEGALLKLLEERRRKLAAEGLFDTARKRRLPYLPEVIGIVTSPSGAVIRDILHRLEGRFPRRVLLWPVLVQGPGAAEQVASAIAGFNRIAAGGAVPRPDLLIVARGGGSIEDLWAFNEEIVVRAVAASAIPLISAIGHETDTTLIDFAADLRAPTPTAAAELAVPVRAELATTVLSLAARMVGAMDRLLAQRRLRLTACVRGLPQPQQLLDQARQRLDDWSERLALAARVGLDGRRRRLQQVAARLITPQALIDRGRQRLQAEARMLDRAIAAVLTERRRRLEHAAALLQSNSYQRVLQRGFALILDRAGHALTSVTALLPGSRVRLRLADGEAAATIDGERRIRPDRGGAPPAGGGDQGSLF